MVGFASLHLFRIFFTELSARNRLYQIGNILIPYYRQVLVRQYYLPGQQI